MFYLLNYNTLIKKIFFQHTLTHLGHGLALSHFLHAF